MSKRKKRKKEESFSDKVKNKRMKRTVQEK